MMRIRIEAYLVTVEDWGEEGAAGNVRYRGDTPPTRDPVTPARLDELLEERGFPPLAEWQTVDDEPGRYEWSRIEDADGCENDDGGAFIVDYSLYLEALPAVSRPYVRPTDTAASAGAAPRG